MEFTSLLNKSVVFLAVCEGYVFQAILFLFRARKNEDD